MIQNMSPALKSAALPALAAALVMLRWFWQGTTTVWTKLSMQLYLPDPDLGWRRSKESFIWLGLDAALALFALALGSYLVLRLVYKRWPQGPGVQWAVWLLLATTLLVPALAFASGHPGKGARETPGGIAVEAPTGGVAASLSGLPAGTYTVIEHRDAAISAQLVAGGEAFEARFAGGLQGVWIADPGDLSQPMQARISVRTDSIETGIPLRNQHALEDLEPASFPKIEFTLQRLDSTRADDEGVQFAALGEFALGGKTHQAQVTGTLREVGPDLRKKLSLQQGQHLLVRAGFTLDLRETVIGNDGTFDKDQVPVNVTLILQHSEKSK